MSPQEEMAIWPQKSRGLEMEARRGHQPGAQDHGVRQRKQSQLASLLPGSSCESGAELVSLSGLTWTLLGTLCLVELGHMPKSTDLCSQEQHHPRRARRTGAGVYHRVTRESLLHG